MLNYPLKFEPILKPKIWGGSKLKNFLKKDSDKENLGESWEISGMENDLSIVENGVLKGQSINDLIETFGSGFLGKSVFEKFGKEFPLLIKFIDANSALSVQLHPHEKLARERHNSFGKTEMWYIMQADEGAEINIGFKKTISKQEYLDHLGKGKITDLLNFEKVKMGDSFFINTGKVHAIGAGVLLAEIQQTSDITYRIYDWDRKDAEGNFRELHTDLAVDAIDLEKKDDFRLQYAREKNTASNIARSQYFTTNYLPVNGEVFRDLKEKDSFVIYMCVSGRAKISTHGNYEYIDQGQTILIPAQNTDVMITSEGVELLEVYID